MKKKLFFIPLLLIFLGSTVPLEAASIGSQFRDLVAQTGLAEGDQSACLEDASGKSLYSLNEDMRIIPASVSKLYVFDWALTDLPVDFTYTTDFFVSGKTLYINGTKDPHFVIAHMRSIIQKIYQEKGVVLNKFVFSPGFYFNWQTKPKSVQSALYTGLKAEKGLPIAPKISVVIASKPYQGEGIRYQFDSAPLPALLKQTNDYSTNVSADVLFERLGGTLGLAEHLKETYGVDAEIASFDTGSGLRGNFTTCQLTLRMLRHLHEKIKEHDLELTDIMSVPTVDPGVLKNRLIDRTFAASLVAKSGFINHYHTLAGVINTKTGPLYFGVFTESQDSNKGPVVKAMIDKFVDGMLVRYKRSLKPFDYIPDATIFQAFKIAGL